VSCRSDVKPSGRIEGPLWTAELAYWKDGSQAHRDAVRFKLTPDAVRNLYVTGTRDPLLIDPDNLGIFRILCASLPFCLRRNVSP
jgi:hypothetical protein